MYRHSTAFKINEKKNCTLLSLQMLPFYTHVVSVEETYFFSTFNNIVVVSIPHVRAL